MIASFSQKNAPSVLANHICCGWSPGICVGMDTGDYRKISDIRCAKSSNLIVSRLVLHLSLPNPLKPGVKSRLKMKFEQRWQAMLQLHLSDRQFCSLILQTWRYLFIISDGWICGEIGMFINLASFVL